MSRLTVYLYPKCSTCRDAVKWLKARGHEIDDINLFEHPPGEKELLEFIEQSGLDIKKFFNTSGELYREMNLKDKLPGMTKLEQVKLLSSNGRLIKRPIITDGKKTTVAFKKEELAKVW